MSYKPRLKEDYSNSVVSALMKKLGQKNIMQVPKLEKIVVSRGVGSAVGDKKLIDHAIDELTLITGQRALATLSKKDVASFKLRKGTPIGVKVTLRGDKMFEFLDRLITIALPRVRDFQGINNKGFDGRGNYTLGIKEQIIFPEINFDKVDRIRGMDLTVVTSGKNKEATLALLKEMNFPFIENKKEKKINWGRMAKTSAIQRNLKRIKLSNKFMKKRRELKKIIKNRKLPLEERFNAQLKLAKLPPNSARIRVRNRCEITGRSHGVYRKLRISRIALRELASKGRIPGMTKSSW